MGLYNAYTCRIEKASLHDAVDFPIADLLDCLNVFGHFFKVGFFMFNPILGTQVQAFASLLKNARRLKPVTNFLQNRHLGPK